MNVGKGGMAALGGLVVLIVLVGAAAVITSSSLEAAAKGRGLTVTGRVASSFGPVEGARVRVQGRGPVVLTDAEGRYELPVETLLPGPVRVTAGKEGLFNNGRTALAGQAGVDIALNPLYLGDDPGYQFISPGVCARCHTKLAYYWDQSKMSRTTSNKKLWDMYYGTDETGKSGVAPGYRLDFPESEGDCALCHAPSAAVSRDRSFDLQSILADARTEWNGVSCDYCHKTRKVTGNAKHPSRSSAVLERQTARRGRSILVFGPYSDVVAPPMAASYSPVFSQGKFCATCHNHFGRTASGKTWDRSKVYTDREWNSFGIEDDALLPIQTTYQEWKGWQDSLAPDDPNKGKACQQCHMSWQKRMLPYDNYVIDGMARHMWGVYRQAEEIHPHVYEGGAKTQLSNALSLEVEGETTGDRLRLKVNVTNTNGGHWVPTGEPMRSIILLVKAVDSEERPLVQTGGGRLPEWVGVGRPEEGNYAGLPGAVFAKVLADEAGNLNVPFWRAARIVSDTRIRPKTTTTLEFEFQLTDPDDEPSAEVKLIYRPVHKALAQAKKWPVEDLEIISRAW